MMWIVVVWLCKSSNGYVWSCQTSTDGSLVIEGGTDFGNIFFTKIQLSNDTIEDEGYREIKKQKDLGKEDCVCVICSMTVSIVSERRLRHEWELHNIHRTTCM
jgi:hypothetical protein